MIVLALLGVVGCARAPDGPPNVLLVSMDTVRWDRTTFGGTRDTTPNLAALAAEGWWARSAYSVMPHTSKSVVTTLCGTWPRFQAEITEARFGGLVEIGRCAYQ